MQANHLITPIQLQWFDDYKFEKPKENYFFHSNKEGVTELKQQLLGFDQAMEITNHHILPGNQILTMMKNCQIDKEN